MTWTIEDHAAALRQRLAAITGKSGDPDRARLPNVRISSPSPQARRSSINRTASSQATKLKVKSGAGTFLGPAYGPGQAGGKIFAAALDGTDLIIGFHFEIIGEIKDFTEILINDAAVPGTVTVNEHLGTTSQTADSILSNISGYTDTLVTTINGTDIGVPYIAMRIPEGAIKGFPRVTAKYLGNANVEDTRTSTTAYSDLPALCFRNWLESSVYGPGLSVNDSLFEDLADFNETVPADDWQASHNYAEGDFCKPTSGNTLNRMFECTADAGSSGGTEPSPWNTTLGATTTDAGITWTCRDGRRHICGMKIDTKADLASWIETWRTACGAMFSYGESGVEVIPDTVRATDHTFTHAAGQILESPSLSLQEKGLSDAPTVIKVIYTDTSGEPWRDAVAREAASGVDSGTVQERTSTIYAPWIHRYAQAKRLAKERLNEAQLIRFSYPLHVFDEGLKVKKGDVIETTHPVGLTSSKARIMDARCPHPGRAWVLSCHEYNANVYSNYVCSEPEYPDFTLNSGVEVDFAGQVTGSQKPANSADVTTDNPQGVAWILEAIGSVLPVANTSAKCTDPDANETEANEALSTKYLDGSENRSTDDPVDIRKDLRMQDGVDISFYSSSTYRGGIFGHSAGLSVQASRVDLIGNVQVTGDVYPLTANYECGTATYPWEKVRSNAYYASGGLQGITQSGSGVTNFDYVITDGLITSLTEN